MVERGPHSTITHKHLAWDQFEGNYRQWWANEIEILRDMKRRGHRITECDIDKLKQKAMTHWSDFYTSVGHQATTRYRPAKRPHKSAIFRGKGATLIGIGFTLWSASDVADAYASGGANAAVGVATGLSDASDGLSWMATIIHDSITASDTAQILEDRRRGIEEIR
jgi:hypothetical protein